MKRTVLGLLLFLATAFLFAGCSLNETTALNEKNKVTTSLETTLSSDATTSQTQETALGTVTIEIVVMGDNPDTTDVVETEYVSTQKEIDYYENDNLFDLVSQNFDIEYDTYSFGHFITRLDVLEPADSSEYIGIYVNDVYSMEGIDTIALHHGDVYQFELVSSGQ